MADEFITLDPATIEHFKTNGVDDYHIYQMQQLAGQTGGSLSRSQFNDITSQPVPTNIESFTQGVAESAIPTAAGFGGGIIGNAIGSLAGSLPYVGPAIRVASPVVGAITTGVTANTLQNDPNSSWGDIGGNIVNAVTNPDNLVNTGLAAAGWAGGTLLGSPLGGALASTALPAAYNYIKNEINDVPDEVSMRQLGQQMPGLGLDLGGLAAQNMGRKYVWPDAQNARNVRDLAATSGAMTEDPNFGINRDLYSAFGAGDRTGATSQGELQQGYVKGAVEALDAYGVRERLETTAKEVQGKIPGARSENTDQVQYEQLPGVLQSTIDDIRGGRSQFESQYSMLPAAKPETNTLSKIDALKAQLEYSKKSNLDPAMDSVYGSALNVIDGLKTQLDQGGTLGEMFGNFSAAETRLKELKGFDNSDRDAARAKNDIFTNDIDQQIQRLAYDAYKSAITETLNRTAFKSEQSIAGRKFDAGTPLGDAWSQLGGDISALINFKEQVSKSVTQTSGADSISDPRLVKNQGNATSFSSQTPRNLTEMAVEGLDLATGNQASQLLSDRNTKDILVRRPQEIMRRFRAAIDLKRNGPRQTSPWVGPGSALTPYDQAVRQFYNGPQLTSPLPTGPQPVQVPQSDEQKAMGLAQMQMSMNSATPTPPEVINSIITPLMPERNFADGMPRKSGEWDDKAIFHFVSSIREDPRATIGKELIGKLIGASQANDTLQKRKLLTDLTKVFPDKFEPGMGIDDALLHPEDQKNYLQTLQSGIRNGTVDSEVLAQQMISFADPNDGRIVPYRQPKSKTIRNSIFLNPTSQKVRYDY